jgi:hypothetical protein
MPRPHRHMTPRDRLEAQVDRSAGPDACHPFTGAIHHTGYGVMLYEGRQRGAHVVAWILATGREPGPGMQIRHKVCDNPPCCNAEHLREGTPLENMADKVERGRQFRMPGESHVNARLTWDDVHAIRARYAAGADTLDTIAADYPVGRSAIQMIVTNQRWIEAA